MREKFVRPLGGRQSREGRVRARFRRMRVESDVEFVLPVRLESRFPRSEIRTRKLPREHNLN